MLFNGESIFCHFHQKRQLLGYLNKSNLKLPYLCSGRIRLVKCSPFLVIIVVVSSGPELENLITADQIRTLSEFACYGPDSVFLIKTFKGITTSALLGH